MTREYSNSLRATAYML